MSATIKLWLDYFGGPDILWLLLGSIAFTQLAKILLKAFGLLTPDSVRPLPYLFAAFLGLALVDFSTRGVLIGVACGMVSSLGYFTVASYLEREAAPDWQKKIAARMALK